MRCVPLGLACTLLFAGGHGTSRAQDPGPPSGAASATPGPRGRGEVAYLVLHKAGSALGFYDRSGRLVETVPVGAHPHEMVLAPDGRHVYITDNGVMLLTDPGEGGDTVSIVDVAKRERVGVIGLGRFRRPHGIALDAHAGRLLVTTELPDRLLVLDPASRRVVRDFDPRGRTPHMVTLGPGGRVAYVSNSGSGQVAAIDVQGGEATVIPTGECPQGGALAPDGRRLYVTSRDGSSIAIIDTAGRRKVGEIQTGRGPNRVAVTPDGRLLVYSLGKGSAVGFADAGTGEVVGRLPLEGSLVSLSLSPDGSRAFASAQELDRVYIISVPGRRLVGTIRTPAGPVRTRSSSWPGSGAPALPRVPSIADSPPHPPPPGGRRRGVEPGSSRERGACPALPSSRSDHGRPSRCPAGHAPREARRAATRASESQTGLFQIYKKFCAFRYHERGTLTSWSDSAPEGRSTMRHHSDGATHIQAVTFKVVYPHSPFYPSAPVLARFSGVLTSGGQLHVKLDAGSIPGVPTSPGIPVHGTFSLGPDEMPMTFSGVLSNNMIHAEVPLPSGS